MFGIASLKAKDNAPLIIDPYRVFLPALSEVMNANIPPQPRVPVALPSSVS
jgi:hypothetical protein